MEEWAKLAIYDMQEGGELISAKVNPFYFTGFGDTDLKLNLCNTFPAQSAALVFIVNPATIIQHSDLKK